MTSDIETVRAARKTLELSAEDFGRAVRVKSGRTVRFWEAGDREVPGAVLELIAIWTDPRCPAWIKARMKRNIQESK